MINMADQPDFEVDCQLVDLVVGFAPSCQVFIVVNMAGQPDVVEVHCQLIDLVVVGFAPSCQVFIVVSMAGQPDVEVYCYLVVGFAPSYQVVPMSRPTR